MLHELPITNLRLTSCHEDWQQMTPTAQGRHCRSCNREVVDFTQATLPALIWAKTGAADGHLCGRFRPEQLAPAPPRLRPKLRWFLAAALLVLVQGLSAQQAVAQVRRPAAPAVHQTAQRPPTQRRPARRRGRAGASCSGRPRPAPPGLALVEMVLEPTGGIVPVEYLPRVELYPGMDLELVMHLVRAKLQYPTTGNSAAQVLVRFTVDAAGRVLAPTVERSAGPAFDTEALRVVRQLQLQPPAAPAPAEFSVSLPIYFRP